MANHTTEEAIQIQERRDQLLRLRRENRLMGQRQLAALLGVSVGTINSDLKAIREELTLANMALADEMLAEEIDRLESLYHDQQPNSDNPKTAAVMVNIAKQIQKLKGLETTKVDVTTQGEKLPSLDVEGILAALAAKTE